MEINPKVITKVDLQAPREVEWPLPKNCREPKVLDKNDITFDPAVPMPQNNCEPKPDWHQIDKLTKEYSIDTILNLLKEEYDEDKAKKDLLELFIRFDTIPRHYSKKDYQLLLTFLCKSILNIYEQKFPELADVAYTGSVQDLIQDEYFILDCGTSTYNI